MRQRLELTLQPKLILTPEMQISLEVLSAPLMELREMVDRELLENPFLEELPPPADAYYPEEDEQPWWERLPSKGPSLSDELVQQVAVLPDFSERERKILIDIAKNINSEGFLAVEPQRLAQELGVSLEDLERLRKRFMELVDPPGCGALNTEEYLKFQLEQIGIEPEENLEAQVRELVEKGYVFKPYPAWGRGEAEIGYVEPDAFVVKVGATYQVYLNERYTPRLVLNENYRSLLYQRDLDSDTLEFLKAKMKRSVALMKAIEQRNKTLRRTVEAIVELEKEFLDKGPAYLKPLTLKEVSEKIDLHVSTVSRVVNAKYVHTPYGTFPLKFFFEDKGFQIKRRIKEIIDSEDKTKPLSDSAIARLLKEEGFDIARRTVAKYREELGIPSSSKRRVRNAGNNNRKKR